MPVIQSLNLTNQSPISSYTASLVASSSFVGGVTKHVVADGLGNQVLLMDTTSSYTLNGPSVSPYCILTPNATNNITISFATASNQQLIFTTQATYRFTSSNMPGPGKVSDVLLYVSNSISNKTCIFTYPSNWVSVGGGWPTSINSSSVGVFWFRAIDNSKVIGTYGSQ